MQYEHWGSAMTIHRFMKAILILTAVVSLSACGGRGSGPNFGKGLGSVENNTTYQKTGSALGAHEDEQVGASTIWDLFRNNDTGTTVKVNRYIWNASLEVLDFLPIQSVDPFSGVIVTGYGTPPGGGRSYRATVYIKDPALDARSLNVALQGPGGRPIAKGTVRAIEDAILARARQLRIADGKI